MAVDISLVTYSTGPTMVREVLGDWLQFVGVKPRAVVVAVSPYQGYPAIYDQLVHDRIIDRLLPISSDRVSIHQVDPLAIRTAIESVESEWVMLVKLDTLPYRQGHDDWLEQDLAEVQKLGLWGITGSFRSPDAASIDARYSRTQCYSNNFSLFRKSDWLTAIETRIGKNWDQPLARDPLYQGDGARFAVEAAIEATLRDTHQWMLMRRESRDWSVFHVNVWGDQLRQVRDRYLQRIDLDPFLNTGQALTRKLKHPWEMYYGYPAPSWLQRLRIRLGAWRRGESQ